MGEGRVRWCYGAEVRWVRGRTLPGGAMGFSGGGWALRRGHTGRLCDGGVWEGLKLTAPFLATKNH